MLFIYRRYPLQESREFLPSLLLRAHGTCDSANNANHTMIKEFDKMWRNHEHPFILFTWHTSFWEMNVSKIEILNFLCIFQICSDVLVQHQNVSQPFVLVCLTKTYSAVKGTFTGNWSYIESGVQHSFKIPHLYVYLYFYYSSLWSPDEWKTMVLIPVLDKSVWAVFLFVMCDVCLAEFNWFRFS